MKVRTGGAWAQMAVFKLYFVCSLSAIILRQTYPDWILFAKKGLELKETWKR